MSQKVLTEDILVRSVGVLRMTDSRTGLILLPTFYNPLRIMVKFMRIREVGVARIM